MVLIFASPNAPLSRISGFRGLNCERGAYFRVAKHTPIKDFGIQMSKMRAWCSFSCRQTHLYQGFHASGRLGPAEGGGTEGREAGDGGQEERGAGREERREKREGKEGGRKKGAGKPLRRKIHTHIHTHYSPVYVRMLWYAMLCYVVIC